MTLLLDTHSFLWFIADDPRLSVLARTSIEEPSNVRLLSIVSAWEIAIKYSLGKLELATPFDEIVTRQLEVNDIQLLDIATSHLQQVTKLPFHHRDPFDRLLVAQSLVEGHPIVGRDPKFDFYGVRRIW